MKIQNDDGSVTSDAGTVEIGLLGATVPNTTIALHMAQEARMAEAEPFTYDGVLYNEASEQEQWARRQAEMAPS